MKKLILLVLALFAVSVSAQSDEIRFAVISSKFDFQRDPDQYGLNTLTKAYFSKIGFESYLDNETMPIEASTQGCNRIFVNVNKDRGLLTTKVVVEVKDCRNNIIFTSKEGRSKVKDYKTAYNEALREALQSIDRPALVNSPKVTSSPKAPAAPAAPYTQIKEIQVSKPVQSEILHAQAIPNGFQLVDTTPKIVLKMYKTSELDLYIATDGVSNGVVIKDGPVYHFEYYNGEELVQKQLNIKF